jgi:hypothetical protein
VHVDKKRLTRIILTGAAAALCVGVASPAVACPIGPDGDAGAAVAAQKLRTVTLAEEKARIDTVLSRRLDELAALAARVAADPRLNDAQKAAFAARVAKLQAALEQLQAAVDAATSTAELRDILRPESWAPPTLAWPRPLVHRHAVRRQVVARAPAQRVPAPTFTRTVRTGAWTTYDGTRWRFDGGGSFGRHRFGGH